MTENRTSPYSALLLRLALGVLFLAHDGLKYFVFTPALWIVGLVALALSGDGAWAVKPTPVAGGTRGLATANREEVL